MAKQEDEFMRKYDLDNEVDLKEAVKKNTRWRRLQQCLIVIGMFVGVIVFLMSLPAIYNSQF